MKHLLYRQFKYRKDEKGTNLRHEIKLTMILTKIKHSRCSWRMSPSSNSLQCLQPASFHSSFLFRSDLRFVWVALSIISHSFRILLRVHLRRNHMSLGGLTSFLQTIKWALLVNKYGIWMHYTETLESFAANGLLSMEISIAWNKSTVCLCRDQTAFIGWPSIIYRVAIWIGEEDRMTMSHLMKEK